jgi:hypothetical protein
MLAQAAADEAAAALGVKRIDAVENLQCLGEQIDNIDSLYRANDAGSSGRAESPDVTFQRPPAQVGQRACWPGRLRVFSLSAAESCMYRWPAHAVGIK